MKALLVLLAVAGLTSAFPNYWRDSSYMNKVRLQQNVQCSVIHPAIIVCQSARVTTSGRHAYVHICPTDGEAKGVCINSKLPTCCEDRSQLEASALECVSTTQLTVSGQAVNVKIYKNAQGEKCLFLNDPNIERCCVAATKFLKCPEGPKPCLKERDVYFLLDATESIGQDLFCRFGYLMQLIVAAINPSGGNTGTRVASLLYGSGETNDKAIELFGVSNTCDTIVDSRLSQVVYEYYAVGTGEKDISEVIYKSVQAKNTRAKPPMSKANELIKEANRNSSVVILTDGRNTDGVQSIKKELLDNTDVLIAAGIGPSDDITEEDLQKLGEITVYEPDRDNVNEFAERIVRTMNQQGALCTDEASRIIEALEQPTDIYSYCTNCLFKDSVNQQSCNIPRPQCGAETLQIQSIEDKMMGTNIDKEVLREEILAAIERVIEAEEQKKHPHSLDDYLIRPND